MANYLESFKTLLQSDEPYFRPTSRYQFYVQMDIDNVQSSMKTSVYDKVILPNLLGYLVRSIELPNFEIHENEKIVVKNIDGAIRIPGEGTYLTTDNEVKITFLDTDLGVCEGFFYPWLKTVVDPNRKAGSHTFPRAVIRVFVNDNYNEVIAVQYKIVGAYPTMVSTPTLNYEDISIKRRDVIFAFNEMQVIENSSALLSYSNMRQNSNAMKNNAQDIIDMNIDLENLKNNAPVKDNAFENAESLPGFKNEASPVMNMENLSKIEDSTVNKLLEEKSSNSSKNDINNDFTDIISSIKNSLTSKMPSSDFNSIEKKLTRTVKQNR